MQNERQEDIPTKPNAEISLKELILQLRSWMRYISGKWKVLLILIVLGAVAGIARNKLKPLRYIAKCNFILDEGNKSSSANLGGLALLGINNGATDAGLFQGKNLIWLYSSRLMLQKALLEPVDTATPGRTYMQWFLEIDEKGKKAFSQQAKSLKFDPDNLTRNESNIISFAVGRINSEYLKVEQAPNAENIIMVKVSAADEHFAESFANKIIEEVNEYYIRSKTQKLSEEIAVIQHKVDSFQQQMTGSMYQAASSIDAIPNPNPNRQVLSVPTRRKSVDVGISSELFIEMNKNLEAKRMMLASETPLIQVLEKPQVPLETNRSSLVNSAIIGMLIFLVIGTIVMVVMRIVKLSMQ